MDEYTKDLISTFDRLSETYKNDFVSMENERLKIESLVDIWNIKTGSIVLEVGGGTGDLTPFIMEKIGKKGALYFLDISSKMIVKAKSKLSEYKNITFLEGDVHTYQNPAFFDQIIIFNTFPHFKDKEKAFKNCFNLLKPNGRLVISHNNSRWSIVGHHKRKNVSNQLSEFLEDTVVNTALLKAGFNVDVFINNEGLDYYIVMCSK